MKFLTLTRYAFALVCASLLASCGGGGAEVRVVDQGAVAINPPTATWYAGVMNTLTIAGGTPPFQMSSSEPGIFPVPLVLNGRTLDVVPLQPGVIDAGLGPTDLPVRTVNLTARDATGATAVASIKVAQNFLTGYSMFVIASTCAGAQICAGGESTLVFDSTFNGALYANHQFRIERVRGPFQFIDPLNSNNQTDVVTVTSDHEGKFTTVIRVATNVPTQVAILKITDLQTGATTLRPFTINTTSATAALTLIPDTITLTGRDDKFCGFGFADVLVFDGVAPYTATCPNSQIQVLNPTSTTQPGRFTFNVTASDVCLTGETCVIVDATGTRAQVTFNTVKGPAAPAPPALAASPTSLTITTCGGSGVVTVVGGKGSYSASSSHQQVTASVSGNQVTITRNLHDAPPGTYPTTATISITDGASIVPVTVTVPAVCV